MKMAQLHPAHSGAPRPAVRRGLLLGGLAAASLALVSLARLSGWESAEPDAPTLRQRRLQFRDEADGSISVIDDHSRKTLDVVRGEQGFVRGVLRSMARERRRQELGSDAALDLLARSDGRLTLLDPQTGRRVDLESFGPTNAAVFARWLDAPVPAPRPNPSPQETP